MDEELNKAQPLTQAQMEAWVGVVEDKAWLAQSESAACRFVLGNLLQVLHNNALMDAKVFIDQLTVFASGKNMQDDQMTKLGIDDLLQDLKLHFHQPSGSGGEGSQGGAFH